MSTEATLATVLGSSVVAAIVAHYFQQREWFKEHSLLKLEELHVAYTQYKEFWLVKLARKFLVEKNRAMVKELETKNPQIESLDTIDKLTHVYFPRLIPPFTRIREKIANMAMRKKTATREEVSELLDLFHAFEKIMHAEAERARLGTVGARMARCQRWFRRVVSEQMEQS